MSDPLRRSSRLRTSATSRTSTTSNSEEGWYLLRLSKSQNEQVYGIYSQSQLKMKAKADGSEMVRVNNLSGYHHFTVVLIGKSN
jgi:hypothetical protein